MFWVLTPCRLVGRHPTEASTDESTRRRNPEEHHNPHRRGNLKAHKIIAVYSDKSYETNNYTQSEKFRVIDC
jgi:hypothetical protein